MAALINPKAMFCATKGLLLLLDVGADFEGRRLGHGLHPLAELVLVVEQVGDLGLGVLVLGAPEQRVERAHLDADPAVHAQRVVDVEAVEHAHRAVTTTLTPRWALLLVTFDVDAPVRTLPRAQHADRAVLFLECDDAPRARHGVFPLVRVLHRDGGLQHRLERDAEAADHPGDLLAGHQVNQTLNTPVSSRLSRPSGMRTFHASDCSWSSR